MRGERLATFRRRGWQTFLQVLLKLVRILGPSQILNVILEAPIRRVTTDTAKPRGAIKVDPPGVQPFEHLISKMIELFGLHFSAF